MENAEHVGLSIESAVKASGIGRTVIFKLIKEGKLRAKKCGRRTIIRVEDLKAFLDALPEREVA